MRQLYRDLDAMRAHAKGYKEVVVEPEQTVSGVDFSRIKWRIANGCMERRRPSLVPPPFGNNLPMSLPRWNANMPTLASSESFVRSCPREWDSFGNRKTGIIGKWPGVLLWKLR
jgi:hypothetical protein